MPKQSCNKTQSHPANSFDKPFHHSVSHYHSDYKKHIRYKKPTHDKPSHQITSKTPKQSKTKSSPKFAISHHALMASGTHTYTSITPLKEYTSKSNLTNSAQEEIPKPTKPPNHVMPSPMPTTGQTELWQYPSTPTPTTPAYHHTITQLNPS